MTTIGTMPASSSGYIDPNAIFQSKDLAQAPTGNYYCTAAYAVTAAADAVHRLPISTDSGGNITANLAGFKFNCPVNMRSIAEIDAGGYHPASYSLMGNAGQFLPVTLSGSVVVG